MSGKISGRNPTPKQKELIAAKLKNPEATSDELAVASGYSSGASARNAMTTKVVKDGLKCALEKAGATHSRLAKKMVQLLDAKKETDNDYVTQHKGLETILKVRGDLAQPREGEGNTFAADIINNIFLAIKGAEDRGIFPKGTLREES